MRHILVGSVESTEVALSAMLSEGSRPTGILTLPTSHARRHSDYVDLRSKAQLAGVEVFESVTANSDEAVTWLRGHSPTVIFVIGWSELLSSRVLDVPSYGCVGYHPAPLPQMRGRGVIPWQILEQMEQTAGSLLLLDEGIDSGHLVAQEAFAVPSDVDARALYDAHMGALRTMLGRLLSAGSPPDAWPTWAQDETRATYCSRRVPQDGLIDWGMSAREAERLVRATTRPYPGAYSRLTKSGQVVHVWRCSALQLPVCAVPGQVVFVMDGLPAVQCAQGQLLLEEHNQHGSIPAIPLLTQDRFMEYGAIRALEATGR